MNKKYSIFTLILLLFAIAIVAQAQKDTFFQQNFKVEHLGVEDGLSQGSVYCMLKDSRGFMWFSSYEGLNRYDGHHFKVYRNNYQDSLSLRGTSIKGIVEDTNGNVWVGTEECLNVYIRSKDHFIHFYAENENGQAIPSTHFPFSAQNNYLWYGDNETGIVKIDINNFEKEIMSADFKYKSTYDRINTIIRSQKGHIWMRQEMGIVEIDLDGNIRYYFSNHPENQLGEATFFFCVLESAKETIWLGSKSTLTLLNPTTQVTKSYDLSEELKGSNIGDIKEYPEGYLWVGTNTEGIFIFDMAAEKIIRHFHANNQSKEALSNNTASNIYIDQQGIVWTNPDPEGIDCILVDLKPLKAYGKDFFNTIGVKDISVRSFVERADGKIWIGMEREGVLLFNPENDSIEQIINTQKGYPYFEDNHARCLEIDEKERLWIGSQAHAAYSVFSSEKNGKWNYYRNKTNPDFDISSNFFWDSQYLDDHKMAFASDAGIYFLNTLTQEFSQLDRLQKIRTGVLYKDKEYLLVPEHDNGFFVLNWKDWTNSPPSRTHIEHFFSDINVKAFYKKTDNDSLWLATTNGLYLTQVIGAWENIELLKYYGIEEGLPSSYIYAVQEGKDNDIWISSNRGISHFDKKSETFTNLEPHDGISGYEFNTNAFFRTKDGTIYFGGVNGFTRINTSKFIKNKALPPQVQITDLEVNNAPLQNESYIGESKEIHLDYTQNNLSFHLAARDYKSTRDNAFKIQLEGLQDDWEYLGRNRIARYTNIQAGRYTFKAIAANNDGIWSDEILYLNILISPPWWRTIWAYALYLLCFAGIIYWFYRAQLDKQLRQQETEKLQEIDALKTRFFTNITHEFRTPLTIILGQAQELQEKVSKEHFSKAQDIEYNGKTLLNLVNQLLELAQIEAGKEQIHCIQTDIIPFLHYLTDSFRSLAFSQKINLSFYSAEEALIMDFDKEKIQRMLTNLISNALKFTPEYGKVQVQASVSNSGNKAYLLLKIQDSGFGIDPVDLPFVFERFYQGSIDNNRGLKGSGVGLTLVKELTELLGGTIEVESVLHTKTSFTLRLPIQNTALKSNPEWKTNSIESQKANTSILPNETIKSDKTSILIIEDNIDVARYIQSVLYSDYQVLTARNGQEGVQVALEHIPDIILCDVMMPLMDGFEVCQHLKQNIKSSHIPILLLTAKATKKDRIEGIQLGADAYLYKPFDKKELFAQIKNLLQNRQRLQVHYNKTKLVPDTKTPSRAPDLETQFLEKIYTIVHQQLDNEAFTGDWLAKEMKMSKSQIYRKLNALTGKSIAVYIRSIRLKEARQLLQTTSLSVQEIAYRCGFSSPAYFSKTFKKEFGQSPNELKV